MSRGSTLAVVAPAVAGLIGSSLMLEVPLLTRTRYSFGTAKTSTRRPYAHRADARAGTAQGRAEGVLRRAGHPGGPDRARGQHGRVRRGRRLQGRDPADRPGRLARHRL